MALKRLTDVQRRVLGTRQGSPGIEWADTCALAVAAYHKAVQRPLTALVELVNTSQRHTAAKVA